VSSWWKGRVKGCLEIIQDDDDDDDDGQGGEHARDGEQDDMMAISSMVDGADRSRVAWCV
jgi:hypothetical protein